MSFMTVHLSVRNLDLSTNDRDLRSLFRQFGKVMRAAIFSDPGHGTLRGIVEMASDEGALAAINGLDQQLYFGNRLSVRRTRATETINHSLNGEDK
jgi:RNA recognition motif-containing protein